MGNAHDAIDAAIAETDRLGRTLRKNKTKQVRSNEETGLAKATALSWFNNHRPTVEKALGADAIVDADILFKELLAFTDRATARATYRAQLKEIKRELVELRMHSVTPAAVSAPTADSPPDFSPLVGNAAMQAILVRRWEECGRCLNGGAPLAATVMMGGLLEALLLARVHREKNQGSVFAASKAPKDKKSGKTLSLQGWTLKNFIDVAHEMGWISQGTKDVGGVLRDYRNYVHPYKELSHNVALTGHDAQLFWEITKSISRQLMSK